MVIRLELKICERCGVIWMRPAAGASAFCASCNAVLKATKTGRALVRRPRGKAGAR